MILKRGTGNGEQGTGNGERGAGNKHGDRENEKKRNKTQVEPKLYKSLYFQFSVLFPFFIFPFPVLVPHSTFPVLVTFFTTQEDSERRLKTI